MTRSELKKALRFPMADHIRIRLCMLSEKAISRRGVLPPPGTNETYGPEILPEWAEKTIEAVTRRHVLDDLNLPGRWLRRLVEYSDRAAMFTLKHAGRGGVSWLAFAVGLLCGVPFLMIRILRPTMGYIVALIPVLYAILFIVLHLILLIRWLTRRHNVTETAGNPARPLTDTVTLYTRWLGNLFWLGLWTVVCLSVILITFTKDRADLDFSWNPSRRIETRLHLHRVIGTLAGPWKLPDAHLVYADNDPMYKFSEVETGRDQTLTYVEKRRNKATVLADTYRPEGRRIQLVYSPPTLEEHQHLVGVVFRVGTIHSFKPQSPYWIEDTVRNFAEPGAQVISVVQTNSSNDLAVQLQDGQLAFRAKDPNDQLEFHLDGDLVNGGIFEVGGLAGRRLEITWAESEESVPQQKSVFEFRSSVPGRVTPVEKPDDYVNAWLDFLAALTFFCGVLLHLLALPVFGVLVMVRRNQLYQEYKKEPYTKLLERLNERPFERAGDRGINVAIDGNGDGEDIDEAPHGWDILVVTYNVEIAEGDEKRYGAKAGRIPGNIGRKHKDVEKVMKWIEKEKSSAAKLVIVCSLQNTPDNPFHDFLEKVMTLIHCELDFKELWASSSEIITEMECRGRIDLWNKLVIEQNSNSSEATLLLSPALEKRISRENQGHA